ncbi:Bis(5'-nucleosyl)-tetraphosphatase, symmetrical [Halotydeus destructor]|nr:Bis(5'-nucleosyl)-tetraphosphatase, symmetrical [Halotydeus destructor]
MASMPTSLSSSTKCTDQFDNPFGNPFPGICHQVLDDEYIARFDEVLVIGDVHGCFDEMSALLKTINQGKYAKSKVLKIFVGDLVNKGPKSPQVVRFMMQNKDCLSVRGNHDERVIRDYSRWKKSEPNNDKRTVWVKDLNEDKVEYLKALPYTISIPSLSAIIVHAGLVPGIPLQANDPENMIYMRNLFSDESGQLKSTDKRSRGKAWAKKWPGPQFVYFGHDAKRSLQQEQFATGLDTRCVYGSQLTGIFIKGPRAKSLVSVKAMNAYDDKDD